MRHNASKTLALIAMLLPLAASAHTGADGGVHHGFATGFLHPLTGADHLAAMVAVGLWSALAARRAGPTCCGRRSPSRACCWWAR